MILEQIQALDPGRVIVIDTETTGIGVSNDEILSLSMVDLEGNVLFDELVRPERRVRWVKAEEINGISPAMVRDKPTLEDHADEVERIWNGAELIVGYNLPFDLDFLYDTSLDLDQSVETFDVMREFAPVWGRRGRYGNYRWATLAQCAKHYGIENGAAHSSIGDAEATRLCYLALLSDKRYQRLRAIRDKPERDLMESIEREAMRVAEKEALDARRAAEERERERRRAELRARIASSAPVRIAEAVGAVALFLAAAFFVLVAVSAAMGGDGVSASAPLAAFFAVVATGLAYGAWRLLRLSRSGAGS